MLVLQKSVLNKLKPLAEGGEAIVYSYQDKVLKLFKPHINLRQKEEKINDLMKLTLPDTIIGPQDIIFDENNKFIGYSMKKVSGNEIKKLCSKKYVKLNNITVKHICKMLIQISETISLLHENNIVIGDLNECNILFDKSNKIYMIDVDSWSIGKNKCSVAMESFQDPKMSKNKFTIQTDMYAFAVIVFKALTMLHPFGGTTEPDMTIIERMKLGLCVIDNKQVTIPKSLCKGWGFFSPKLKEDLKKIFSYGERFSIKDTLFDFYTNLNKCDQHNDYYYSKYSKCPVCNSDAEILSELNLKPKKQIQKPLEKPKQNATLNGIAFSTLYSSPEIKLMLDENTYVDQQDIVHFRDLDVSYSYNINARYYKYKHLTIVSNKNQLGINVGNEVIKFEKLYNSRVQVRNESVYFINPNNKLVELTVTPSGNIINTIQHVALTNYFEVYDKDHYIIYNVYGNKKLVCVDGFNHEFNISGDVVNYGMHYDSINKSWLLIIEDSSGRFNTMIFKKNKLIYQNNLLKYSCDLSNLCFYNGIIYIPKDGAIRGFNHVKNEYKDFACSAVTFDCKLIKRGPKFKIIKESGIFEIG